MAGAHLTVLSGTDGVNDMAAGLVGQGMAILDSLKGATDGLKNAPSVNGKPSLRVTESN